MAGLVAMDSSTRQYWRHERLKTLQKISDVSSKLPTAKDQAQRLSLVSQLSVQQQILAIQEQKENRLLVETSQPVSHPKKALYLRKLTIISADFNRNQ